MGKITSSFCLTVFGLAFVFFLWPSNVESQIGIMPSYETYGESSAEESNFVKARKKAVRNAMKQGLQFGLEDFLGEKYFSKNISKLERMLSRPEPYVRSYRYIENFDDPFDNISRVRLEIQLYPEAIQIKLASLGILTKKRGKRSVLILINEKSVSVGEDFNPWEYIPMAEIALNKQFSAAGIRVVKRKETEGRVSESTLNRAAMGNVRAAIDIGLKVGAEIVIVGNAVSSQIPGEASESFKNVQANLSLTAVSAFKTEIIAAKSDLASAQSTEIHIGELQAFEIVSEKISRFFIEKINQYWEAEAEQEAESKPAGGAPKEPKGEEPPPAPLKPARPSTPLPMEDL